jgi:hypothetical protein
MGIMCVGHIDNLEENAKWLWERYPSGKPMFIKAVQKSDDDLITFSVNNRDVSVLHEAKHKVKEILLHNEQVITPDYT